MQCNANLRTLFSTHKSHVGEAKLSTTLYQIRLLVSLPGKRSIKFVTQAINMN